MGVGVGSGVGSGVGLAVGAWVGALVGAAVGAIVGERVSHRRSDVSVGGTASNWSRVHVVSGVHVWPALEVTPKLS